MASNRKLKIRRGIFQPRSYEVGKGKDKRRLYSIENLKTGETHTGISFWDYQEFLSALERTHDVERTFRTGYYYSAKGKKEMRKNMREGIKTRIADVFGHDSAQTEYAHYLIDKFSDAKWANFVEKHEQYFKEHWANYHAGVLQSEEDMQEFYNSMVKDMERELREKGVLVR